MRKALLILLLISFSAVAPGRVVTPKVNMPYVQTNPYAPEDLNKVLLFFSYTCPFCAQYDAQFYAWGNSFPNELTFEAVPVVTGKAEIPLARGFYAAKATAPEKIAVFNAHVYYLIQSQGRDPNAYATYEEAAKKAGMRINDFLQHWKSRDNMRAIMEAHQRMNHYRPEVTPTLVIKGRFITDPERVNGDYRLLFQLATGILSRIFDGTIDTRDWFGEVMQEIEEEAARDK